MWGSWRGGSDWGGESNAFERAHYPVMINGSGTALAGAWRKQRHTKLKILLPLKSGVVSDLNGDNCLTSRVLMKILAVLTK